MIPSLTAQGSVNQPPGSSSQRQVQPAPASAAADAAQQAKAKCVEVEAVDANTSRVFGTWLSCRL
jgi:hypothetical protein